MLSLLFISLMLQIVIDPLFSYAFVKYADYSNVLRVFNEPELTSYCNRKQD